MADEPGRTNRPAGGIQVDLAYDRRVNFALQQNYVPVVKQLRVENAGTHPLRDVAVRLRCEPEFGQPWELRLESLAPREVRDLGKVDLALSPEFLLNLPERMRGLLHLDVTAESVPPFHATYDVDLLAYDEWSGLYSLPEILAAFVLPNHVAVARILDRARHLLAARTSDPALSGYQSKSLSRAREIAGALYDALAAMDITYVAPPASFENDGQKIRLPDRVLDERMGTCLDLSVLLAAAFEQAGLNPVLTLLDGHALVGVWLADGEFPEPSSDDGLALRKRVDLGEVVLVEATGVSTRPPLPFERAVGEGKRRLDDLGPFRAFIDVRRARHGRVLPIPLRTPNAESITPATVPPAAPGEAAPTPQRPAQAAPAAPPPAAAPAPAPRLELWKKKLLDLTLRNRLLNFRETKKTVPILCPDQAIVERLEDLLAEGGELSLLPRIAELAEDDPRDAETHRRRTGEDAIAAIVQQQLVSGRVHTDLTETETARRLTDIYREARTSLEEGGASALYLAVGFLAWYESEASDQVRLAPILLIPIDVVRPSVHQAFRMRLGEGESRINVTLLEMLRHDFGLEIEGLDPLPEDASGVDVAQVFQVLREAVRDIPRWDVRKDLRLGFFSFAKFLMWRDLCERADDLLRSPLVRHLALTPGDPFPNDGDFSVPERLDDERALAETFCPLSADSSQLAAVHAAADGRTFVLEGPPGTGKSQTIANLIAHCLARGRTVLFVSEKMAALSVVYTRLCKLGLGLFSLELHSNKARKIDVIHQLGASLSAATQADETEWARVAASLQLLRGELNAYARALHERRKSGESVFQVTSRLVGLRDSPSITLAWKSLDEFTPERLAATREAVDILAVAARDCDGVAGHPWSPTRHADWSAGWQILVSEPIDALAEATLALGDAAGPADALLGFHSSSSSLSRLFLAARAARFVLAPEPPPEGLLQVDDWRDAESRVRAVIAHGHRRDELRELLLDRYSDAVLGLDFDGLEKLLDEADRAWFLPAWLKRRRVRQSLQRTVRAGFDVAEDLRAELRLARELRTETDAVAAAAPTVDPLLRPYWREGEPNWRNIEYVLAAALRWRALARDAAHSEPESATDYLRRWHELAKQGAQGALESGGPLVAFRSALRTYGRQRHRLDLLLRTDRAAAWGTRSEKSALDRTDRRIASWRGSLHRLQSWCTWLRSRGTAIALGLEPIVRAAEDGRVAPGEYRRAFERGYGTWWRNAVIDGDAVLREFSGAIHRDRIVRFCHEDDRHLKLAAGIVNSRLAARLPSSGTTVNPNSEVGILRHELAKRRRHLPLRQLFRRIPGLLPRLKPCLLMSPMSVAQYLDPAHPPFDLVVFDEASQIPAWDAAGALARGSQAVIAGDPKQLPPTSFFARTEDEEVSDDTVMEDLESILDDCMAAGVRALPLDWHYRSRHESLIAFSNRNYYDNRLLTFPSADLDGAGVQWREVPDGTYDRNRTRTNRREAEAIVAEVVRRLRDPQLSEHSIGIVTFSIPQQGLVEDLLDEARRLHPEIERYFGDAVAEPLFVKNLENVQGDEREAILFSICYGPDDRGRVAMNFGPLNRDGGERRLNVAITRARRELIIFSTLRSEQIDLARTQARGVADLKTFLDYAERGPIALAAAARPDATGETESPLEDAICKALEAQGWTVHAQVGCSGYRIDLAVVDPDRPGRYLLGVECDGATYHRARTARDRDRLREDVLRGLGWEIHRVWSTDWWNDPGRELERIKAKLAEVRERGQQAPVAPVAPVPQSLSRPLFASAPPPAARPEPAAQTPDPPAARASGPPSYKPLLRARYSGTQEQFLQPNALPNIACTIEEVVSAEGPIVLGLLASRVAGFWGFERVGQRVHGRISACLSRSKVRVERDGSECVIWPNEQDSGAWSTFRVPDPRVEASSRTTDEIPLCEIVNAMVHVLKEQVSLPEEALIRETARIFGFQRTGVRVEERMRGALARASSKGAIVEREGSVSLGRGRGPTE